MKRENEYREDMNEEVVRSYNFEDRRMRYMRYKDNSE